MAVVMKKASKIPLSDEELEEMAVSEVDMEKYYYRSLKAMREQVQETLEKIAEVELKLAVQACPFKVGQRLKTNKGLGLTGLLVQEIASAKEFSKENRWMVVCVAISKAGEVTKRVCTISECESVELEMRVGK